MPPKPDMSFVGLDDSIYKFKISEIVASLTKNEKDAPKTSIACVEKPKEDRSSAPLIQDWDTDSDDDSVFRPEPIPAKIIFAKAGESVKHVKHVESIKHVKPVKSVKHVKPDKPVKTVEHDEKFKNFSSSPKVDRKEWNGKMIQKLRLCFGFTKKACFVCGSLIHLIKDCTFHEDRMAKKSVLPTNIGKGTGHKESRSVWNNVQRINHQNKFAPTTVFTRSGRILVSVAKPKAAASTSAAKQVNTIRPKQSVNFSKSRISVVKGDGVTAIKTSAGHPQQALKNKGIVDNGCSRHMIGNKAYLTNYQEINNGCFVAFGSSRGIKREYSNARTPQQNEVTERKNMTLIKVARTMLADSLLPITFWAEAVNTACYVLNRALVTKIHNKTPYKLLNGRTHRLDFMRPFGSPVTILNTLDPLGKFKGKVDEGFLVGYSVTSKAFRGIKLKNAGPQDTNDDKAKDDKPKDDTGSKTIKKPVNKEDQAYRDELDMLMSQEKEDNYVANALSKEFKQGCMDKRGVTKAGSANSFNTVSNPVNAASTLGTFSAGGASSSHPDAFIPSNTLLHVDQDDSQIPDLEDPAKIQSTGIFNSAYDDDLDIFAFPFQNVGVEADFNNMESSTIVSLIPTHRVHLDHPKDQILGDPKSAVQTMGMEKKSSRGHAFVSYINKQRRTNHKDYENCLFACFLSQMEPKKVAQSLNDESWVEAMQEKLLQFSLQKDTEEEGINYDEVFAPVARIEAIRIFLAFASFMGFIVYQMDVKSAFLYGTIEEEDKDDIMLLQVYVDDIIFGSTKKSLCDEFEALMHKRFQMSSIGEFTFFLGLQVKHSEEGIFISQDKYVAEILKKFDLSSLKTASTPIETQKPLVKDEEATDVDVYLYRSMIGFLMYLTTSRPYIMFAVCACSRDSPFDLETYSDSDYVRANLDRKSTTGVNSVKQIHDIIDGKAMVISESSVRSDILFNDKDEVNTSRNGEDKMEHPDDLTDFVPPTSHDSPLSGGYIPGSDVGRPNLLELMNICTQLSNRVLALEEAKTTQDKVITRLKLRVRMLEKKRKARTSQPIKRILFKGRVETSTDKSLEDKGSGEKGGSIADQVSTAKPETLIKLRSKKEKVKGVAFRDVEEPPRLTRSTTTLQPLPTIDPKDKGKGVLVEEEPEKQEKVKRKDQGLAQIKSDADLAQRIYDEELVELDRAQKEKQKQKEATIAALTEEFDEIQARMDADHELAIRMTHEEQEKYTIKERVRLLAKYFERRKKQLAEKRAEAIRNKPPTRTQVRNKTITYLKHMGNYTYQQLKHKTFKELYKLYQKEQKWINDFVPMDSEKEDKKSVELESKGKKGKRIKRVADSALKHKSSKKQKMIQEQESTKSDEEESADYEHENKELRMWLIVVSDEKETIDEEILSTNYPRVNWES
nr:hypothetical protein [Tanacetum cinerariifolium]